MQLRLLVVTIASKIDEYCHAQDTVSSDIRACVAHARMEFKPTSLALMGFCYGGGRALEEAVAGGRVRPFALRFVSLHAAVYCDAAIGSN